MRPGLGSGMGKQVKIHRFLLPLGTWCFQKSETVLLIEPQNTRHVVGVYGDISASGTVVPAHEVLDHCESIRANAVRLKFNANAKAANLYSRRRFVWVAGTFDF